MPNAPATIQGKPAPVTSRPTSDQVIEYLQRVAVFGESTRYKLLDRMEAFFRGLQYQHQHVDFWGRDPEGAETISPNANMPPGYIPTGPGSTDGLTVRDCRPTAPKGMCKTIVKRYTGLLLAEKRKPQIIVDQDPETDAFLSAVREQSEFWPTMRAARDLAGATGAVVITAHLREGEFSYDIHNAKNVTPVWKNKRKFELSGLLVVERFVTEEDVAEKDGKPGGVAEVLWVNRRIITEQADLVFKAIRLDEVLDKTWEIDWTRSSPHGLGFFPGIWIQNHADTAIDGDPDCDQAWQTIDTIDRLLAQMNKGTLLNLDPTVVLGYDPKNIAAQGGAVKLGSDNALHVGLGGSANLLEMNGGGTTTGLALLAELMKTVRDLTGYVPIDPDKISGSAQSAKAMEYLLEPMLERADDLRAQFGPAIVKLQKIVERMARSFIMAKIKLPDGRRGRFEFEGLPPRKVQKVEEETGKVLETYVPQKMGPGGHLMIIWPRYFQPTTEDEQKEIANAAAANSAGFVTKKTAARKAVGEMFGVKDIDGEVAAAREEAEQDALSLVGGGPFGSAGLDGGADNFGGDGGGGADLEETDAKLQTKVENKIAAAAAARVVA